MKSIAFIFLLVFYNICFSYCQPKVSNYNVEAFVNGTMKKEIVCQKNQVTIKNHLLVDLWFYHVAYDETAVAKKSTKVGLISYQYKVEDSRKNEVIGFYVEKNGVDLQSVPYVLSYQLAKGLPLAKQLKVFSAEGGSLYRFQRLTENEKIKTSLGILDAIKVQGKCSDGYQLTYWFSKDGYSMVKEDISKNGDSVMAATIVSQSADLGCCWD